MCPITTPEFKRGDTFNLTCTYKENGVATSIVDYTLRSQVKTLSGVLLAELEVTVADQILSPGVFYLKTNSTAWPIGNVLVDIQFVSGSTVRSTQTFLVPVVKDVTV
jgi:hypothetical protein